MHCWVRCYSEQLFWGRLNSGESVAAKCYLYWSPVWIKTGHTPYPLRVVFWLCFGILTGGVGVMVCGMWYPMKVLVWVLAVPVPIQLHAADWEEGDDPSVWAPVTHTGHPPGSVLAVQAPGEWKIQLSLAVSIFEWPWFWNKSSLWRYCLVVHVSNSSEL